MNESFLDPSIWNTVNFYTYGLSEDTEFAVTLYDLGRPARDSLAIAVGYKNQIDLAEDGDFFKQIKSTHGVMLPVNLRGQGLGFSGYGHISVRVNATGTRLTAGMAGGTSQLYDKSTLGGILAVEQPLTSELNLVAEWYSGSHDLGNLITGLVYHNHDIDLVLVGGYKIPNAPSRGRNGLVFEIGGVF